MRITQAIQKLGKILESNGDIRISAVTGYNDDGFPLIAMGAEDFTVIRLDEDGLLYACLCGKKESHLSIVKED